MQWYCMPMQWCWNIHGNCGITMVLPNNGRRRYGLSSKSTATKPMHPGANHYYGIHVMKHRLTHHWRCPVHPGWENESGFIAPGVYAITYLFVQVTMIRELFVNDRAVNSYQKSIVVCTCYRRRFLASIHNLHMKANNAMMTVMQKYR